MTTDFQSKESAAETAVYAKVTWRLVPFLFLCYIVAYLDRVNVGFAKLQMLSDLKFSESVYGFGAGIFFIGYFLFEVPSNIILQKVGARLWIARIMISWGVISGAMMFVTSEWTFYVMRFLLGLAEAGFFPGIILYLTYWYPSERRGKITALFMTAVPLSGVIGGPLSGWILQNMAGTLGYAAWQWLFLIEAIPALVMGLLVITYLSDGIVQAPWLTENEKILMQKRIKIDSEHKEDHSLRQVFANARIWLFALIYFCFVMGLYGIGFWLPTIIKSMGIIGTFNIGLLSAVPYAIAVVGMVLVSRSSDRQRERRWHVAIPASLGAVGLIFSAVFASNTLLAMAALSLGTFGIMTSLPLFWSLPTAYLRGTAAAAGIALINSLGNLAGFVSPYLIGLIKDRTHSTDAGMYLLAGSLVLGALLTLSIPAKSVNR
ncbi:MAG: MFS transporter [Polaromonas sp.]|uniref:MFS transporter n=1 Tax=Polaromonas sp. TaxID=1869339 RepID=UPI001852D91F|nr:MFS transporter [Polaromonas sp.]NMM10453.1 MFS transporter [Polaromonas sp.]